MEGDKEQRMAMEASTERQSESQQEEGRLCRTRGWAIAVVVVMAVVVLGFKGRHHISATVKATYRYYGEANGGDQVAWPADTFVPVPVPKEVQGTHKKPEYSPPPAEFHPVHHPETGPVLFLSCGIDGFWSNFRTVPAALYVARAYNLTYAEQELYYKFQDSGRVRGTDGPLPIFQLFDREHMARYIDVVGIDEFLKLDKDKTTMHYGAISKAVRCSGKVSPDAIRKSFKKFLSRYNVTVTQFSKNVIGVRKQKSYMESLGHLPSDVHLMLAGSPWVRGGNVSMTTDFKRSGMFREFSDMPVFYQVSMPMLRFSPYIYNLKAKAMALLGMKPEEPFGAVHIRRGNTYGYGSVRQVTTGEIVDAFGRARDCTRGGNLKTIFVSTIYSKVDQEIKALEAAMPGVRFVTLGSLDIWDQIEPGLSSRRATQFRSAVEMLFWNDADAFVGSRSSMSAIVQLMRLAERRGRDACNRFGMRKWLEEYVRKPVP